MASPSKGTENLMGIAPISERRVTAAAEGDVVEPVGRRGERAAQRLASGAVQGRREEGSGRPPRAWVCGTRPRPALEK